MFDVEQACILSLSHSLSLSLSHTHDRPDRIFQFYHTNGTSGGRIRRGDGAARILAPECSDWAVPFINIAMLFCLNKGDACRNLAPDGTDTKLPGFKGRAEVVLSKCFVV
jgi:hypothetical protein